ncbi:hypothetical protein CJ213_03265 [Gardnerella swidsinskii]|uniref:Uncharacterized protein n=1 Tax=Gardnerella swidsinskii TaxID=2792979 RepID=A0A9X7FF96_9BIFI|nr:hypothetical protein CJ213_03265 [Gardnerella swidsinskii]RIY28860.1 hypothetical protein CJI49_04710 [Bifidobacteriaceae bacterium NR016]
MKAHRAFNLSKLTLRVAFARYTLSAKAGRHARVWRVRAPSSVQKICTQTNMEMYENEARIKA